MESLSDLQDRVQRDLAWRKLEISDVRGAVRTSDPPTEFICRAGLVILCAHWEGFLKKASSLYIEHVFAQDIKLSELAPNIIAIAYFDDVITAALANYPGSEENHIRLARKISATWSERVSSPGWDAKTGGNPGTDVLERILRSIGVDPQLGMDAATWATTRVFINEQLVRDRHHVAHGEGLRIPKESMLERTDRLLELLDRMGDLVLRAAENRSYLGAA